MFRQSSTPTRKKKAMLAAQNEQLYVDSCGCSDAKKNGTTKQLFTTRKN